MSAIGSASAAGKAFSVVLSPGTVAAGSTVTMTATLTNETSHQRLGSANLFWPSGFDVTAASVSPGTAAIGVNCSLNGLPSGPCVQLRNLSLDPGASATATLTVRTASPCSSYTWRIEAKQANDFNGQPGNDLDLDAANSNLTTQVSSPCAVALRFGTQPHNAQTGDPITGADQDPSGPPVTVEVIDQASNVFASSNAPITMGLGDNPSGGILSGTRNVNASGGVAAFGDLSINLPGDGYTLAASSPGLTGATSTPFNIFGPPLPPPPPPPPNPGVIYQKTLEIDPVSGVVCFKPPGGTKFHAVNGNKLIHVGSIIDASSGEVRLVTAKTRNSLQDQHGRFSQGPFRLTQAKNGPAFTQLELVDTSGCQSAQAATGSGQRVYNHHRRHKRLYGSGRGKYRTRGHHGSGSTTGKRQAAQVREPLASTGSSRTKWLTEDRRNGTYFRVDKGTLVVRDFTRNRKVKLHAGQHYLAPTAP